MSNYWLTEDLWSNRDYGDENDYVADDEDDFLLAEEDYDYDEDRWDDNGGTFLDEDDE